MFNLNYYIVLLKCDKKCRWYQRKNVKLRKPIFVDLEAGSSKPLLRSCPWLPSSLYLLSLECSAQTSPLIPEMIFKRFKNQGRLATLLEGAGCAFTLKKVRISLKTKNGVIKAVKLEKRVIIVRSSIYTTIFCKKNGQFSCIFKENCVLS